MNNIDLLLNKNNKSITKIKIQEKCAVFDNKEEIFSGKTIGRIIKFVNSLHNQYPKLKIPIIFNLGEISFIDKLSYILLECICYNLIVNYKQKVHILCTVKKEIGTEGAYSSPLLLLNGIDKDNIQKFGQKFIKDTYGYHLRRVINGNELENSNYLGLLYQEVDSFLKIFSVDEQCRDDISEVVAELVGNACEHAGSDCLVDIDVSSGYNKSTNNVIDEDNYYYGINIVVVNFSETLLGNDIKKKVSLKSDCETERYKKVYNAYDFHKKQFNDEYKKEDFYNITAFQHKISGRQKYESTGGTGLTQLVKSLEERSEAHRCYVISGDRALNFYQEMLEFNSDQWIGFNEQNDYFSNIPENGVVTECLINMPGTAYNLNFVMKGEKINGE
jgi:hypothetical protein